MVNEYAMPFDGRIAVEKMGEFLRYVDGYNVISKATVSEVILNYPFEKTTNSIKRMQKKLQILLENYQLSNVPYDEFLNKFQINSTLEAISFILEAKNGFELSKYGNEYNENINTMQLVYDENDVKLKTKKINRY